MYVKILPATVTPHGVFVHGVAPSVVVFLFLTGLSYGISVDWMDSTQEEVAFWQEMMSASNEWIEGLLPLRSLAGRKKLK